MRQLVVRWRAHEHEAHAAPVAQQAQLGARPVARQAGHEAQVRRFELQAELQRIEAQNAAAQRETGARIDRLEQGLMDKQAEAGRSLSAYLGEIEDKLDRVLGVPRA